MWDGLESRKFPRVKANCKIALQGVSGSQSVKASTENIGAGGICVILPQALDKMSRVQIELDLLDGKENVKCAGRVVWTVRKRSFKAGEQGHDTGIEFIDLSTEEANRIRGLVTQSITARP